MRSNLRLTGPAGSVESDAGTVVHDESPPAVANYKSRGCFLAAAAEAMRRILVEQARRKHRLKRGGDRGRVELDVAQISVEPPSDDILALDEALAVWMPWTSKKPKS